MMNKSDELRSELASESLAAYRHCREAAFRLIAEGGEAATPEVLALLHDAAEIHSTLADFLLRDSRFGPDLIRLCQTIGEACAEALEPHTREDASLRIAYGACRQTGQSSSTYLEVRKHGATPEDKLHEALLETFPASDPVPPPTEI